MCYEMKQLSEVPLGNSGLTAEVDVESDDRSLIFVTDRDGVAIDSFPTRDGKRAQLLLRFFARHWRAIETASNLHTQRQVLQRLYAAANLVTEAFDLAGLG